MGRDEMVPSLQDEDFRKCSWRDGKQDLSLLFCIWALFFFSRILLTKLENDGLPFQGREESVFEDQELEELDK